MVAIETRKLVLDVLLLAFFYAFIYTALVFFIYPVELLDSGDVITSVLGSAFFFGILSGFFTGLVGGLWVNRLNFRSPISVGLITGILSAIFGSILFPFLGAFVRVVYFGENPLLFYSELAFLVNYSLIGIAPGIFVGQLGGILGGVMTGGVGT